MGLRKYFITSFISIWVPISVNNCLFDKLGLNIISEWDKLIVSFLILNIFMNSLNFYFLSSEGFSILIIEPIFLIISLNSFWLNLGGPFVLCLFYYFT